MSCSLRSVKLNLYYHYKKSSHCLLLCERQYFPCYASILRFVYNVDIAFTIFLNSLVDSNNYSLSSDKITLKNILNQTGTRGREKKPVRAYENKNPIRKKFLCCLAVTYATRTLNRSTSNVEFYFKLGFFAT